MFRIVGVETGDHPRREFVVIRNQSLHYENLRGWAIADESYFGADPYTFVQRLYVFRQDMMVEAGAYIAVCTGTGEDHWSRAADGCPVYVTYWGKDRCVWCESRRLMLLKVATVAPASVMIKP